jgi:hypothetical protein
LSSKNDTDGSDQMKVFEIEIQQPQVFTQSYLNNLIRDLGLPKDAAHILGSRLQDRHLLARGTSLALYRNCEKVVVPDVVAKN